MRTSHLWGLLLALPLAVGGCAGRATEPVSDAGASGGTVDAGHTANASCSACDSGPCFNGVCCHTLPGPTELDGTACESAGAQCGPSDCALQPDGTFLCHGSSCATNCSCGQDSSGALTWSCVLGPCIR